MAYLFQVDGGPQKIWRKQLTAALEKQATLSYERAHPESLKKEPKKDEGEQRRRRFGIAMSVLGLILLVMGLKDFREQWVVSAVGVPFLAWGIAHLLPKPEYRGRYRRAAKILTKQREKIPSTTLTFDDAGMAFEETQVPYENFDMVISTEDLILLTWDNGHILYVPKQDLTEGDPVEFIRYLSRKIGKRAIKL